MRLRVSPLLRCLVTISAASPLTPVHHAHDADAGSAQPFLRRCGRRCVVLPWLAGDLCPPCVLVLIGRGPCAYRVSGLLELVHVRGLRQDAVCVVSQHDQYVSREDGARPAGCVCALRYGTILSSHWCSCARFCLCRGAGLVNTRSIPFLYCFSQCLLPRPSDWRSHVDVTGGSGHARVTRFLVMYTSMVSVATHASGFWLLDESKNTPFTPEASLLEFLAAGEPPIFVGYVLVLGVRRVCRWLLNAIALLHTTKVREHCGEGSGGTVPDCGGGA